MFQQEKRTSFINEPYRPTGWQVAGKTLIGILVGLLLAFLIFIIIIFVGESFKQAFNNLQVGGENTINPMLPLILIVIAFLTTFIGNIIITGSYNLFYSNKYYDISKMFSFVLLINILLFFIFAPIYLIFYNDTKSLFFVLAFHVFFAIYASYSLMEFSTNPSYCGVHLIGTTIGLAVAILFFAIIYRTLNFNQIYITQILLILPVVLVYTFMPLFHAIREKIYYKFYEVGNNFLYIPSLEEVLVDSDEEDNVNVVASE